MLFSTLCIVTIIGEMIGVLDFLFGEILMKTTTCLCEAASIESTRIARVGGEPLHSQIQKGWTCCCWFGQAWRDKPVPKFKLLSHLVGTDSPKMPSSESASGFQFCSSGVEHHYLIISQNISYYLASLQTKTLRRYHPIFFSQISWGSVSSNDSELRR